MRKIVFAFALVTAFAIQANAAPILDFGHVAPTSGTISSVGAGPLVGTALQVDNVVGLNTPLNNNGLFNLTNAALNFVTGNLVSVFGNTWTFAGGGSISITGGMDANNDSDFTDTGDIALGSNLMAGTFTSAQVIATPIGFHVVFAGYTAAINQTIVDTFFPPGMYSDQGNGTLNLSFAGTVSQNGIQSTSIGSGDHLIQLHTVPEPASIVMLGMGLLFSAGQLRKRIS